LCREAIAERGKARGRGILRHEAAERGAIAEREVPTGP
jgi:hypothetical protein